MRPSKRVIAAILSACMILSSAGTQVQAGNEGQFQSSQIETEALDDLQELDNNTETETKPVSEEDKVSEETETAEETEDTKESGNTEENSKIEENSLEKKDNTEENNEQDRNDQIERDTKDNREIEEDTKEREVFQKEDNAEVLTVEDTKEEVQEEGTLKYIMQESTYIQTPGVQNVAAELGKSGERVTGAQLQYKNTTTGQEMTIEAVGIVENMVRFTMEYNSENQTGVYQLERITWQTLEKSYVADLKKLDMKVVYGVNRQIEAEADDLLVDQSLLEEVEANIVTMDKNGQTVSENSVAEVLEQAQAAGKNAFSGKSFTRGAKNMVIVLDPGHDSTHAGARGNGCVEEDLVLKIATYCKAELQKYNLVTVYMTRETKSCPNGGSKVTSATCNAERVEFARKKGADVYVSFHLNSSVSSTPRGVGVYYPNGSYRSDIGVEGKGLATEIYNKLKALGLSTWAGGILIRNSENNTLYPDGSLADYLAVIRRSKEAGFPAVLIEHAFLSNASDAADFLSSDAKLKKLGVADAQGIAEYYDLSLKGKVSEITSVQSRNSKTLRIKWGTVTDASSYQVYRSTSETGDYSRIAEVTGTSYDDKVDEGVTYFYKVRSVYSDRKKSGFSQPHSGKTLAQPQITKVVSKASGKLNIFWNKVEDASQYEILRSEQKKGPYAKVATVGADSSSYVDSSIKTQKNYYYKVRARGGEKNGYSSYSNVLSGWTVKKTKISSVSSKTSTSLQIKWKKVDNAYAYRIQRSTSKNGKYKTIATIKSANTTTYEDKKLKTGKTYYYKIEVQNRVNGKTGYSGYCSAVAGSTIKPTSIVYVKSKSSSSMEIKWKKDSNAYAYRIKRSTAKDGKYTKVADVKGAKTTKYVDKTITSGKKYYYVVETITKKKGVKQYSGNSKAASATNIAKVKVQSIRAEREGIKLTWKKTAGANCYQIMRSTEEKGTYTEVARLEGSAVTSYTDTGVKAGKRYYYKIRARKNGKYIGYGSYDKGMEKWFILAPENLQAAQVQPDQIKLSWKKVSSATGYEILRSNDKNKNYKVIATLTGGNTLSYIDQTVVPGTDYYYKVAAKRKAKTAEGRGEETTAVSGSTSVTRSEVMSIDVNENKTLDIQIKEVPGAYGYEIQRSLKEDQGFETIGTLESGTKTYTDINVVEGTTYYYRVRTIWRVAEKDYYSDYSEVKNQRIEIAEQK